jgi:hypothetical protein
MKILLAIILLCFTWNLFAEIQNGSTLQCLPDGVLIKIPVNGIVYKTFFDNYRCAEVSSV